MWMFAIAIVCDIKLMMMVMMTILMMMMMMIMMITTMIVMVIDIDVAAWVARESASHHMRVFDKYIKYMRNSHSHIQHPTGD